MAKENQAKGGQQQGKGKGGGKGAKSAKSAPPPKYKREQLPRLRRIYESEIRDKLREEFSFANVNEVPRLVKISINMGLGEAVQNPKLLESAVDELRVIAGQAPVVCLAKRDIATFKLRKNHKIGVMVTLRHHHMWEFLDRLVNVALPRVRDFRGVSPKAFDGRGNFSLGIKEQIIFPEIEYDKIDSVKGMNVTVVTTAKQDEHARSLLRYLGMPFRGTTPPSQMSEGAQA
jgi:large subunit ribosomal protein L5